jgi:arylsulfatase A-like enzyme
MRRPYYVYSTDILINAELHRGAVRKGNWKLVKHAALPSRVELYDVVADPSEEKNMARQHPRRVAELEALLNEYAKQAKPALYFTEYMPFIIQDVTTADLRYDGDEDSGQPGERPALPK